MPRLHRHIVQMLYSYPWNVAFSLLMFSMNKEFKDVKEPAFLKVGHGLSSRNIAYLYSENQRESSSNNTVGVMFLPGFRSTMDSTKGSSIAYWAREKQKPCMLFDYSGHGQSEGLFTDGTISSWLEEATAVFEKTSPSPMVLVGSSMGGYLALLLGRKLQSMKQTGVGLHDEDAATKQHLQRIRALVLLAPAWDMTEELFWKNFSPTTQQQILQNGVYMRPSRYEDGPYPITRDLILDGRKHLLRVGTTDKADEKLKQHQSACPQVEILHGCRDMDVPITHSERLVSMLRSRGATVRLTKIMDGGHRLSSPQHLKVLFKILDQVAH